MRMPILPEEAGVNIDSRQEMQKVIPYVSNQLCAYLCRKKKLTDDTPLRDRLPLKIEEGGQAGMTSYKPAWDPVQCSISLI